MRWSTSCNWLCLISNLMRFWTFEIIFVLWRRFPKLMLRHHTSLAESKWIFRPIIKRFIRIITFIFVLTPFWRRWGFPLTWMSNKRTVINKYDLIIPWNWWTFQWHEMVMSLKLKYLIQLLLLIHIKLWLTCLFYKWFLIITLRWITGNIFIGHFIKFLRFQWLNFLLW